MLPPHPILPQASAFNKVTAVLNMLLVRQFLEAAPATMGKRRGPRSKGKATKTAIVHVEASPTPPRPTSPPLPS